MTVRRRRITQDSDHPFSCLIIYLQIKNTAITLTPLASLPNPDKALTYLASVIERQL